MADDKFPITEAQLVGMFMECVAYGALLRLPRRGSSLTLM